MKKVEKKDSAAGGAASVSRDEEHEHQDYDFEMAASFLQYWYGFLVDLVYFNSY